MSRAPRNTTNPHTDRYIADLVREGVVESVDLESGMAIVALGDITSPPLPWAAPAGDLKVWAPPSVGEQVIVLSLEGDISRGLIIGAMPSTRFAPLFLGEVFGIDIKDQARCTYDPAEQRLKIELTGAAELVAPQGLKITADVEIDGTVGITGETSITGDTSITGKVAVEGNIDSSRTITGATDVVGAGKSLKSHTHSGVSSGSSFSGPPR